MPRRFDLVSAFFMSALMSLFMSAVVTAINLGVHPTFTHMWMHAWVRVFPVAFVAVLMFRPVAWRVTVRLVGQPEAPTPQPAVTDAPLTTD